jgi:ATP-binding cassette subfamily B (MDR/TAP) protein 1
MSRSGLQDGIGEKMAMLVFFWSSYLLSHVVAFVYGWELTLVLMAVIPTMSLAGGMLARAQASLARQETAAYAGQDASVFNFFEI